jgi:hypothetical protein
MALKGVPDEWPLFAVKRKRMRRNVHRLPRWRHIANRFDAMQVGISSGARASAPRRVNRAMHDYERRCRHDDDDCQANPDDR